MEMLVNVTIQPLKKINLALLAGSDPGTYNLTDSSVALEFIYGVASDGLCPFESVLHDKLEGDTLLFDVGAADAPEFFGHIFHALHQALGVSIMAEMRHLKVVVSAVIDADAREVVHSVAKALAHGGCGGSCGCGC